MSEAERIVIVGGGPAAKAAAEAYREADGAGAVTILAREADPPYERPPLTKDFLRGESGRDELPLAAPGWYKERGIELRTGAEVTELDLGATAVRTAAGDEFGFDRLLLATGADPLVPSIPGADGPGIQTVRRIGDSERLAELGRGSSALVAGSGFIGCEAAASLAMRGVVVTMATLEAASTRTPRRRGRRRDLLLARIPRRRVPRRSRVGRAPPGGRPLHPRPLHRPS